MATNWTLTGEPMSYPELDDALRRLALIASAVQRDGARREFSLAGLRFAVEPALAEPTPIG
ncbi:MAG: hypothetical protein ACOC0O_07210, partial [Spirochaetota bacterium]